MIDIKPPAGVVLASSPLRRDFVVARKKKRERTPRRRRSIRFGAAFAGVIMIAIASYVGIIAYSQNDFVATATSFKENISISLAALMRLDNHSADSSLRAAKEDVVKIKEQGKTYGIWRAANVLGVLWPKAKIIPDAIEQLEGITSASITLNEKLEILKSEGASLFFNGEGEKFVQLLESIRNDIGILDDGGRALLAMASEIKFIYPLINNGRILSTLADIDRGRELLDTLIPLLRTPVPMRVIVLFQNPSEIRPAGGFVGSFADITIRNGGLEEIEVYDIYYPDGQLEEKIVPPKPLQLITTSLGARDANWFFDFSVSAQKVVALLEESDIYQKEAASFDGVIAINTDVIASAFDIIGPIELPEYGMTLAKENFLSDIQAEVEAGPSKARGAPKQILRDLTPIVISRLHELNDVGKNEFIQAISRHLSQKDIMLYFENSVIQSFLHYYEFDGAVYELPNDYNGDYLAVVNANIAGGKTDVFVRQNIALRSSIDIAGMVQNELVITRTHSGGNEKLWLYNVDNKNYLRVYTPPSFRLIESRGGVIRKIRAPIDYEKNGYRVDPDIARADEVGEEFGKAVFDAWKIIKPGTTGTLEFLYESGARVDIGENVSYQFVFDKQSGVRGGIELSIEAPPGYRWRESQDSIFLYENENPNKRIVLSLTMEKM